MKKILKHPRKLGKNSTMLLAAAAFALSTSSAFAQVQCLQNTTWRGSTGNWFTTTNWNNGVPNSSINAQVNNGGTAQITSSLVTANACTLTIGPGAVSVDALLNVVGSVTVGSSGTGLLALGNSATVSAGSLTVGKSGTLQFDVIPATTGTVNVTGTATLNATSTVKVTMTGTFTPGTQYTLVTATGGVSGTFGTNSITYPHGQGFIPQITYDATHVYLYLVQIP